jgi:peptide/nickel transport system permease protein
LSPDAAAFADPERLLAEGGTAQSETADAWSIRKRQLPWFSLGILGALIACAVFAPWLAPHDPAAPDILHKAMPPGQALEHPLGTDTLGRDILSRLIFGARTSVVVGVLALFLSAFLGTLIGLVAGYSGGRIDVLLMRITDVGLSFPTILFALVLAVFLGVGVVTLIVAVTTTMWARFARMIRGEVLSVRGRDFVTLAKIAGVGTPTILWRHILPNVVNTLLVTASLLMAQVILMEASLGFLGLGLPPGAAAWGVMVAEGREVLNSMWWLSLFPGVAITLVVVSLNLFGDWLRDTLDPRLRDVGM